MEGLHPEGSPLDQPGPDLRARAEARGQNAQGVSHLTPDSPGPRRIPTMSEIRALRETAGQRFDEHVAELRERRDDALEAQFGLELSPDHVPDAEA